MNRFGTNFWCGAGGSDWVCQRQGSVFVNDEELTSGSSVPVPAETKVSTASGGVARLVFPGQARCVVGRKPTVLYTRVGGYGALYTQTSGSSACKTHSSSAHIFCGEPREACPRKMNLRGEALTTLSSSTYATASFSEAYTRSGRIVVCDGYMHIQIPNGEGGLDQAEGRARPGFQWVVDFEESFARAEEPGAKATAFSGSITVVGYELANGSCRSQVANSFNA